MRGRLIEYLVTGVMLVLVLGACFHFITGGGFLDAVLLIFCAMFLADYAKGMK